MSSAFQQPGILLRALIRLLQSPFWLVGHLLALMCCRLLKWSLDQGWLLKPTIGIHLGMR